jgi:ribosomal protein S18 acetylase RimI-like enzyme
MKVREASMEDIKFIESLSMKLMNYHLQFDEYYRSRHENVDPSYFERLIKSEDSNLFVAEDNGIIVGYLAGKIEKRAPVFEVDKRGWIDSAYVLKEYRGRGIGKELTERMLEWFKEKGIKCVEVSVDARNQVGYGLWKSLGFKTWQFVMKKRIDIE